MLKISNTNQWSIKYAQIPDPLEDGIRQVIAKDIESKLSEFAQTYFPRDDIQQIKQLLYKRMMSQTIVDGVYGVLYTEEWMPGTEDDLYNSDGTINLSVIEHGYSVFKNLNQNQINKVYGDVLNELHPNDPTNFPHTMN
jgi:hypothetical protein